MNDPALRRLVGGVLWPGYLGREVPGWLRRELADGGLAGVVLFSHNLPSVAAFRDLRPGLLVGIDEEAGNVTRLEAGTGSTLPGAAQLGFVDDPDATTAVGRELAERSLAVGANVVLAPVADVNTDPRNPVIGVRAFGSTPELVSRHVAAAVRGIQSAGAAACVKHFPGHGDTHLDSHLALPRLTLDPDEIERMHLPPFQAAIDAGVAAVMTGHLVVPAWGDAPATLNPAVLGRLRVMGFDGVIVTDALDMAAVRETVGAGPGAVQALLAGADLLCVGNPRNPGTAAAPDQDQRDFREVQLAILAAIDDGALPVAVLERAAARVGALGAALAGGGFTGERGRVTDAAGTTLDAASVARAAITADAWFAPVPAPRIVLDVRARATVAVDGAGDHVADALAAGGEVVRLDGGAGPALRPAVAAVAEREDPLVVLVDAVGPHSAQRDVIEQLGAIRPGAVVVNVGVPGGPLPLAALHTRAASRLAAEAADAVLAAGGRLEAGA
ncbi:glycoside hydrolase family 3 protein [Agromyces bauzanensis]